MKANELRIGNLVKVDNLEYHPKLKEIPFVVTGITEAVGFENERTHTIGIDHINKKPNTYYPSYSQLIQFIKPIPLTEEMLLSFGLYVNFENEAGKIYKFREKDELIDYPILAKKDEPIKFRKREIYLHDLQNIYFALTGKELNIIIS